MSTTFETSADINMPAFETILEFKGSPDTTIAKVEKFDIDMAQWVSQTQDISSEEKRRIKAMLKSKIKGNQLEVNYILGRVAKHEYLGRWIAKGSIGLQGLSRDLRSALAKKYYWDVDFKNCQVEIMRQMAIKHGWVHTALDYYCDNRDRLFSEISKSHDVSRDAIKQMFIRILFGGNRKLSDPDFINNTFFPEVFSVMNNLALMYPDIYTACKRRKTDNAIGSCCAQILQTEERKCLEVLDYALGCYDRNLAVYIHDGGYVEKLNGEKSFPEHILRKCEEIVTRLTNYNLTLSIKPIETTFEIDLDNNVEGPFHSDKHSAETAFRLCGDKVKITYKKNDEFYGYIWNEDKLLWDACSKENIQDFIINALISEAKTMLSATNLRCDVIAGLEKSITKMNSSGGQRSIFSLCIALFQDFDFKNKLDSPSTEFLCLRDKFIYNMKTGERRIRNSRDLYTSELLVDLCDDVSIARDYLVKLVNEDRVELLLHLMGYFFSNLNNAKMFFIFIGLRDTGKSTFFTFIEKIMGRFSVPMNTRAVMRVGNKAVHEDELLTALRGTKMSLVKEIEQNAVLSADVVKRVIGNDSQALRGCKGNTYFGTPVTKLGMCVNTRPEYNKDLDGKLYHFTFPNKVVTSNSVEYLNSLNSDPLFLDGLFTLIMRATKKYYDNPVLMPSIDDSKYNKNSVDEWIEEMCELGTDSSTTFYRYPCVKAYDDYTFWCRKNNRSIEVKSDFSSIIEELTECESKQSKYIDWKGVKRTGKCYIGIRLSSCEVLDE